MHYSNAFRLSSIFFKSSSNLILNKLNYFFHKKQPPQFKLDQRLAKLLGIHTATRPTIIQSLWQYIKTHKLQDNQEKEFINLDKYLAQIFECDRIRFSDIPSKLNSHCMPPDPIVINHMIKYKTCHPFLLIFHQVLF